MKKHSVFVFLASIAIGYAQIQYEEGDWVSYTDSRYLTGVDVGETYVYFAGMVGILRYHRYRNAWDLPFTALRTSIESRPLGGVEIVAYDPDTDYLWGTTTQGLVVYDPIRQRWDVHPYTKLGLPGQIKAIGVGQNYIWLESGENYYYGNKQVGGFFPVSSEQEMKELDPVIKMHYAPGRISMEFPTLFMDRGYLFFNEGYITDRNLRRFYITNYAYDDWGNLWLTTKGLGAAVADLKGKRLTLLEFGPIGGDVRALALDGNSMWMGGFSGSSGSMGISTWERGLGRWIYYEASYLMGLQSDQVWAIQPDGKLMWVGTEEGLSVYDKKKGNWRTFTTFDNLWGNRVRAVAPDGDSVWVATDMGINIFLKHPEDSKKKFKIERIKDNRLTNLTIYDLAAERDYVWAATDLGLFRYHKRLKVWGFVEGKTGTPAWSVRTISVSPDEVWLGTETGVVRFDKKTGEWSSYPAGTVQPYGPVNDVVADQKNVWVARDDGVIKYDRGRNYWHHYTEADGLVENRVHVVLLEGDTVWFGTRRGLTRFNWAKYASRD
ncbi:hypothetical protein ISS37_06715 [candidate division KSB1 bacterium]|nr:hypothetical protein [candidate division KSB1 bacterium]